MSIDFQIFTYRGEPRCIECFAADNRDTMLLVETHRCGYCPITGKEYNSVTCRQWMPKSLFWSLNIPQGISYHAVEEREPHCTHQ